MRINGVNLNVKKTGSGPPIVALHGFMGSITTWTGFVRAAKKKHSVITLDLLGHGGSDSPKNADRYTLEHSIADISAILRRMRVAKPSWVGYSMGGRIALLAAASNPNSCRSLVLEGASPGLASSSARTARRRHDEALARLISENGLESFTDYWERLPLFNSQRELPREIRNRIRRQRLRNSPIGIANTLRGAGTGVQPPAHRLLPRVKCPVLCVVGERDYKFRTIAKEMCRKLPNGRCAIIPGAGHAPHIEKPHAFNRIVLDFLEEEGTAAN